MFKNLYNKNKNKIEYNPNFFSNLILNKNPQNLSPNIQYINPNVANFLDNEEDKINSYNQYQLDFLKIKFLVKIIIKVKNLIMFL